VTVGDRPSLRARALDLIEGLQDGGRDDDARDRLIEDLSQYQRATVESYGRLAQHRVAFEVPALPTDVFRHARVAGHDASEDIRVFHSSGTKQDHRSHHHFRDLGLYVASARQAARFALFPDRPRMRLLFLAPSEREAPHSSLSFMLSRFADWFGRGEVTWAWRNDTLLPDRLSRALRCAQIAREPIAILGTSFAFVHAEEALGKTRFKLPRGSRIMQTGGYKGRSTEFPAPELLRLLSARYGVRDSFMVNEYGMTELSSQLYEPTLRRAALDLPVGPRRFWVPGWMRASVVDPESLEPQPDGAEGLLRFDDVANLDSCVAIQTSDVGVLEDGEVIVLGRSPDAVPRGCSLSADLALRGIS